MTRIIEVKPSDVDRIFTEAKSNCGFYPDCLKLKEDSKVDQPKHVCALCWVNTIKPEREDFAKNPKSDRMFYVEKCYLLKTMNDM